MNTPSNTYTEVAHDLHPLPSQPPACAHNVKLFNSEEVRHQHQPHSASEPQTLSAAAYPNSNPTLDSIALAIHYTFEPLNNVIIVVALFAIVLIAARATPPSWQPSSSPYAA